MADRGAWGQLVHMVYTGVCAASRSSSFDFGMRGAVPAAALGGDAHHRASNPRRGQLTKGGLGPRGLQRILCVVAPLFLLGQKPSERCRGCLLQRYQVVSKQQLKSNVNAGDACKTRAI